jgi:putative dimethyl sulfoxide reductase chaperone
MAVQENKSLETVVCVNAGRAQFYRTLASLYFKELTQARIDALAKETFEGLDGGERLLYEGYEDLRRYLKHTDSGTRQELACDYAHTFLAAGNYDERMAVPYESVFTSESGLLMQEARDDVYRMYCAEHLGVSRRSREPEDHISFELEFMAHLAERCNEASEGGDICEAARLMEVARRFHEHHLLNWADAFCDAVQGCARTRFYRGVAKITRGYIYLDREVIEDVLAELTEESRR